MRFKLKYIIPRILAMALGLCVMSFNGFGARTWQYWVILLLFCCCYFSGYYEGLHDGFELFKKTMLKTLQEGLGNKINHTERSEEK